MSFTIPPTHQAQGLLTSREIAERIAGVRESLEDIAEDSGESLASVTGSLGLLLYDLAEALGLTGSELAQAVGDEVIQYVEGPR